MFPMNSEESDVNYCYFVSGRGFLIGQLGPNPSPIQKLDVRCFDAVNLQPCYLVLTH